MSLLKLKSRLGGNQGYTIDQTILIVAIIAILITLIIITVGWQLITRATGTKLAAQMRQVEDANGQFYSTQHMWPQDSYTGATAALNAVVLANQFDSSKWAATVDQSKLSNLVPGFDSTATEVDHNLGGGGAVSEQVNTVANVGLGTGKFLVVQFANVGYGDASEADQAIDGGAGDNKQGRLVYSANACLNSTYGGAMPSISDSPTGGSVYACYVANAIN